MSIENTQTDNTVEIEVGKPGDLESHDPQVNSDSIENSTQNHQDKQEESKTEDVQVITKEKSKSKKDKAGRNDQPVIPGDEDVTHESLNLQNYDPFAEADDGIREEKAFQYIHIRIQQRNGRKTLTTVQGLPVKYDPKKILKVIKKKFACNGTTVMDRELGEVIQLQGDQRKDVKEFLVSKDGLGLEEREIKIHGF